MIVLEIDEHWGLSSSVLFLCSIDYDRLTAHLISHIHTVIHLSLANENTGHQMCSKLVELLLELWQTLKVCYTG